MRASIAFIYFNKIRIMNTMIDKQKIVTVRKVNSKVPFIPHVQNNFTKINSQMSFLKLSIFILLLFTSNLFSQSNYTITGSIIDNDDKVLPFANLLLLKQSDSSFVKGAVTDEYGIYKFENLKKEKYLIQSSMIGYQSVYSEIINLENDKTIIIKLENQGEELDEVVMNVAKPLYEQKIDRLVINVENSIVSAGGTALEILERSPGVIVNRQNSSISVMGKDGVQIMINGKRSYVPVASLIQVLDGMGADNIVSIELITTPPANFDAEGNAGFINIITKKNSNVGLNGSYSFSGGYGTQPITSNNINFNYRKNKINFYGNYSFSVRNYDMPFFTSRQYIEEGDLIYTETFSDRDTQQKNHNLRLGLDYDISDKTVVGLILDTYNNKWSMDAFNESFDAENGQIISYVDILNDEINHWKHFGGNLNLVHKIDSVKTISFDVNYLQYDNENPTNYLNTYYDDNGDFLNTDLTRSGKITPLKTWVSKFDYNNKVNEKVSFDMGLKLTLSTFENDVWVENFTNNEWVEDPTLTDKSVFDENIYAAFGSLDYNINKKWALKGGLRYEFTDSQLDTETEGNVVDKQYHEFFPTLFIQRKFTDEFKMNLSYSRRITRPTFGELAPFVILFDPNTFISGNPALHPAISNSIKYDINFKSYLLSFQYTNQDNTIVRFQESIDEDTGRLIFQSENLDFTKTFSLTFGFPIKVTNWWQMQNNILFVRQNVGAFYKDEPVEVSTAYLQANSTQTFKFTHDYSAELTAFYTGPNYVGTSLMESAYSVNFGVQKKLGEKWGTLRFSIDDVFDSFEWKFGTDLPEHNIKTNNIIKFSGRTFKLTYSRSFGNKKVKSTRDRKTGAEEERNRSN